MKTRILLLIAISAIATLSFSFSGSKEVAPASNKVTTKVDVEPIGGFVSEDRF